MTQMTRPVFLGLIVAGFLVIVVGAFVVAKTLGDDRAATVEALREIAAENRRLAESGCRAAVQTASALDRLTTGLIARSSEVGNPGYEGWVRELRAIGRSIDVGARCSP